MAFLLNDSIEFNLKIGKPETTVEELATAMKIACISDFITFIPEVINANVVESGVRPSGGSASELPSPGRY